jgi:predicted AAA+ superfamily ATPase
MASQDELRIMQRIAAAIERLAPEEPPVINIKDAEAYVWDAKKLDLRPIEDTQHIPLSSLHGIDEAKQTLLANTMQFTKGYTANNALLWGARGMGKSSLVKAVHAEVNHEMPKSLVLIEIHRDDINSLPALMHVLRGWVIRRFIIFCDDLSFDGDDASYKSLKAALEGGIEGKPDHILFYATSNRRHLIPRDKVENERSTAIHPDEAVQEKVSLSDRFGLWIGFHPCDQDTYFSIVQNYAKKYRLDSYPEELLKDAHEWSMARGARSGRVAWQFIQDLAGKMGKHLYK